MKCMKKFEFDMNKVSFTKTGEKIIDYFDEYQKASDLVKEAILSAVTNMCPARMKSSFTQYFNESETKEDFITKLSTIKTLINKDCKRERLAAAKDFIDDYLEDAEIQVITDDIKPERVIVRKMVGIKSTNFRQYFDFGSDECDSAVFLKNRNFLENFMNYYVRKKIKDLVDKSTDKTKKSPFLNAAYTVEVSEVQPGRWININVDFIININKLDSNVLDSIYARIKDIEAANFF